MTVKEADYVVIESTYGNRIHGAGIPDYVGDFTKVIRETFAKGGNVVVPSFAVGRTQEVLYFIREIKEKNLLPEYPDLKCMWTVRWQSKRPMYLIKTCWVALTRRPWN